MAQLNTYAFSKVGSDFHIYVPTSLVSYYQKLRGWSEFSDIILPFDDWED